MPWGNNKKMTKRAQAVSKARGNHGRCRKCSTHLNANGTCTNCKILAQNPPEPPRAQAQPTNCGCGGKIRGGVCSKNPCPRGN